MQHDGSDRVVVLMADDDEDDQLMTKHAFDEHRVRNELRFVNDGVELMDYLCQRGDYTDPRAAPRPGLILLDLNMPRMDGREALAQIKSDPSLRSIPVVILTTSTAEQDVARSYQLGSNSFITKPVTFDGMVDLVRTMGKYWLEIVALPRAG